MYCRLQQSQNTGQWFAISALPDEVSSCCSVCRLNGDDCATSNNPTLWIQHAAVTGWSTSVLCFLRHSCLGLWCCFGPLVRLHNLWKRALVQTWVCVSGSSAIQPEYSLRPTTITLSNFLTTSLTCMVLLTWQTSVLYAAVECRDVALPGLLRFRLHSLRQPQAEPGSTHKTLDMLV